MSYRTKLTHDMTDVLGALDRALTMYEQLVQEAALKQQCTSMEARMRLLKNFTERIVDQVQLELLRKAGHGDVRVVRKAAQTGGALPGVPAAAFTAPVPVPRSISGGRRSGRAIAGAVRSA